MSSFLRSLASFHATTTLPLETPVPSPDGLRPWNLQLQSGPPGDLHRICVDMCVSVKKGKRIDRKIERKRINDVDIYI